MKPIKWDPDDKDVAMIGIVILGIVGAVLVLDSTPVITGAITALAALASGRKKG